MKKLAWSVVIVAVLLLLLPGLLGFAAQRQLEDQIKAAEPYAQTTSVVISRYDRGWFSSEVVYEIGLAEDYVRQLEALMQPDASDPPEGTDLARELAGALRNRIEMISQVRHGPVGYLDGFFVGLFRSVTGTGDNNPAINDFVRSANMPYLFLAKGTTGFTGSTALTVEVPPIATDAAAIGGSASEGAVRFSGMTLAGDYELAARAVQLSGGFESLEIDGEEAHMLLRGVAMSADSRGVSEFMWVGPADFSIDRFEVRSKGEAPSVSADDLQMRVVSEQRDDGKTLDMLVEYGVGQLQLPESLVTDATFGVRLDAVSIAALDAYYQMSQQVLSMDEQALSQMQSQAQDLVYQFAQESPAIGLTPIRFTLNGEPFEGNLTVQLDGSKLPAADAFGLMDIGMWSQLASADGSVSLSKGLAETLAIDSVRAQMQAAFADDPNIDPAQLEDMARMQVPMMLGGLVQQGMLREGEDRYSAELKYLAGELTVNGQAMPLGGLLQ